MSNVVVIGSQWGDEGKGKIVDWLSDRADVIVRFQGGHNAGHTLVIDGEVYKLSLLPSGIVREGKHSIIGGGVVVDPWALVNEIKNITKKGVVITPDNLAIAENACLILPIHALIDQVREDARNGDKIGTTGRGIGPAYEDKVGRRAIRFGDLRNMDYVESRVRLLYEYHNTYLRGMNKPEVDPTEVLQSLNEIVPIVLPYAARTWEYLDKCANVGQRILFEGAQGVMLDVDYGTYPFVTSSNTVAGQAAAGSGIGVSKLNYVLGITKAYTTRVGSGPFPTELFDFIGQYLGETGNEFGTVTGRQRRCGWFDAVMVRQAIRLGGIHGIALTKLDVLDGLEEIKVCVGYKTKGVEIDYFPLYNGEIQKTLEPVYITIPGWTESTKGARSWNDLPAAAIKYVRQIEELINCPVALLSTSPERDDTIMVRDPFI